MIMCITVISIKDLSFHLLFRTFCILSDSLTAFSHVYIYIYMSVFHNIEQQKRHSHRKRNWISVRVAASH